MHFATLEADLLIAEAYFFEKKIKFHLDFHTFLDLLFERYLSRSKND